MFCLYVVVQVLLESLPISSSGHTVLFGLQAPQSVDFLAHGPTALMLLAYFRNEIGTFFSQMRFGLWPWFIYGAKIATAEVITGLFFIFFHYTGRTIPLWMGLLITALLLLSLLWTQRFVSRRVVSRDLPWSVVVVLGITQGLALLPGISRLASTLVIARWAGLESHTAFNFSCALQVPLFGGAALLGLWQVLSIPGFESIFSWQCLVSIGIAMMLAYVLLHMVERLYREERLWPIGLYMIIPLVCALFF